MGKNLRAVVSLEVNGVTSWLRFLDAVRHLYPEKAAGILEVAQYARGILDERDKRTLLQSYMQPDKGYLTTLRSLVFVSSDAPLLDRALRQWSKKLGFRPCWSYILAATAIGIYIHAEQSETWLEHHTARALSKWEPQPFHMPSSLDFPLILPAYNAADPVGWVKAVETQAREYAHTATEKLLATGGMVVYDKRNPLHYTAFVLRKVGRLTAQQVQNYIEEKQLAQKPSDIFAETTQSDFLKVMASVMNFQQI